MKFRDLFFYLFAALVLSSTIAGAAVPGEILTNSASASYSAGVKEVRSNSNEANITVARSPSSIEFFRYSRGGGEQNLSIQKSSYYDTDQFTFMDPPVASSGEILSTGTTTSVVESSTFGGRDLILIRVTDLDQNIDNNAIDLIELNITNGDDIERIQLRETAPNSGVFVGYIQTNLQQPNIYDGVLSVSKGDSVRAIYRDDLDGVQEVNADATIVLYSHVFLARDGTRLDGIVVSLVDAQNGKTLQSRVSKDGGEYLFDNVAPGRYILSAVDPQNLYHAPSAYSPSEVSRFGFIVDEDGSYSKVFQHSAASNARSRAADSNQTDQLEIIDIPMDDKIFSVSIEKSSSKQVASVGEFVKFTLFINNDGDTVLEDLNITDLLPLGLKYETQSAKLDGTLIDVNISKDGRSLLFEISTLEPSTTATISYVVQITAGATSKNLINRAWVDNRRTKRSNIAQANIKLEEELWRNRAFIVGQIHSDTEGDMSGVGGVRIYLEDGTYSITDKSGKYHFEGVSIGTHVVQVDTDSLKSGVKLTHCNKSARSASRSFSEFVDLHQGALKRVDFCVEGSVEIDVDDNIDVAQDENDTMPTYTKESIAKLDSGAKFLWPHNNYTPSIPTTKIALFHNSNQSVKFILNGDKVSLLNYDSRVVDKRSGNAVTIYKGVDLLAGRNIITATILDSDGEVVQRLKRVVHVSSAPIKLEYLPNLSHLVADGKESPVIAVKLFDKDNYSARAGTRGEYSVSEPYATQESAQRLLNDPLGLSSNTNRYIVERDGITYIRLQPTTKAGEVTVRFKLDDREEVVRAWLKPKAREWILVGFGEGTVGYETLTREQESLSGDDKEIYQDGRVAFFAKGSIKGEWLLSIAYDSGKTSKDEELFSQIDPKSYYTLYGDASRQDYEASSREKLYLKIEKDRFYALFGDFTTALTYTNLSRYSRSFTGLKSEYSGENLQANFFAASTQQLFIKDEIRGDGTSGVYKLSKQNVIVNSEKIYIEIRDRYRDEIVISKEIMHRYRDYDIDYSAGTIRFKRAIFGNDEQFNHRFIVVDYEIDGDSDDGYTYGGRVALSDESRRLEAGVSYIHEDIGRGVNRLVGVDARVKVANNLDIRAEYAQSDNSFDNNSTVADASQLSAEYMDSGLQARVYYKEQDGAFGLGQLSNSQSATRKVGLDVSKRIAQRIIVATTAYRDSDLDNSIDSDVAEAKVVYNDLFWQNYLGYRYAKKSHIDTTQQLLIGSSRSLFGHKLRLSASHERSLTDSENETFPTRTTLGLRYAITSSFELFSNYERSEFTDRESDRIRSGLRVRPWSGATVDNTVVSEFDDDTTRVFNTLGIQQNIPITPTISINLGYEKAQAIQEQNSTGSSDYSAYSAGLNYSKDALSARVQGEYRDENIKERINLDASMYTQTSSDLALALGLGYSKNTQADLYDKLQNVRLSVAYRPNKTDWIVLDRVEYKLSENKGALDLLKTAKLINNLHLNYTLNREFELSFQYGLKYVVDNIDSVEYNSFTDLISADIRYDLTESFDMGIHGSILHSYSANNYDYSSGLYLGYNLFTNTWLGIGYNFDGFSDRDFSLQSYRKEGAYFRFRVKFDQESLREILRFSL